MLDIFKNFQTKGGKVEKSKESKPLNSENKTRNPFKLVNPQTAFWIGATIIFAALFFMSSVLDMKVHVTFGQNAGAVNSQVTNPGSAAPAGGIASQVGGC